MVRGELVRGPNAITGEWGHNPLPSPRTLGATWPGAAIAGDLDVSRPGCRAAASPRPIEIISGEEVPVPRIVERAAIGEAAAKASLERLRRSLGACPGGGDQHPGSPRGRAGRRPFQYRRHLRRGARAAGGHISSPTRSRPDSRAAFTAIRAECGARPGCGERRANRGSRPSRRSNTTPELRRNHSGENTRVEVGVGQRHLGVGRQEFAELDALIPRPHGVPLHDAVGVVAEHTRSRRAAGARPG